MERWWGLNGMGWISTHVQTTRHERERKTEKGNTRQRDREEETKRGRAELSIELEDRMIDWRQTAVKARERTKQTTLREEETMRLSENAARDCELRTHGAEEEWTSRVSERCWL